MLWVRSPLRVLLLGLLLGGLAQALFFNSRPGISVLVFVVAALLGLLALAWFEKVRPVIRNLWLVAPLLFFAGMVFIRANPLLTFLNIVAVLAIFGLFIFFLAADNLDRLGIMGYPVVFLLTLKESLWRPVPLVTKVAKQGYGERQRIRLALPLVRGLALAVPVLLVFVFLLSSADSIFGDFTNRFFSLEYIKNVPEYGGRLLLGLAVGWVMVGSFLLPLNRRRDPNAEYRPPRLPGKDKPGRTLGFVEAMTVLGLVDLLFMVFAWFQFNYLFSGNATSRLGYEAYRDYVRSGFGQLLLASFLTLAMISGLAWYTRRESSARRKVFNVLCSLMIGLAGVMLVSALWRMIAWENVEFYINSPLRIYVRTFILWLGILFLWQFITLWTRPEKFAIGSFVAGLGFLVTVNLANPDANTAQYNLDHYLTSQNDLGYRYVYGLSDDAVPVVVESFEKSSGEARETLQGYLEYHLGTLEWEKSWSHFPSFNLAHYRAYELLDALAKKGQIERRVIYYGY